MKKNKNIEYGNVELDSDEFDAKQTKVRITTFVDFDILERLKSEAKREGVGYQTLLNQKLRELVLGESASNAYQDSVKEILERLKKLEKSIGKAS